MPNTEVAFEYDGTAIRIVPVASPRKPNRGKALVAHLRRHGKSQNTTTKDEIVAPARDRPVNDALARLGAEWIDGLPAPLRDRR